MYVFGLLLYYSIFCVPKPDSNLKIIPILQKILAYFKVLLKINILMIFSHNIWFWLLIFTTKIIVRTNKMCDVIVL